MAPKTFSKSPMACEWPRSLDPYSAPKEAPLFSSEVFEVGEPVVLSGQAGTL